ncbi:hypothetical protein HOP38_16175 [Vibrio mediterranei]|uniref:hypothetical protein n=1 Tax=Vibrio mediterranei TaxID=689 RepID=UPI0017B8B543|nr:hypothetical protein [Vibrio mediterranei]NUW74029.1 hypothetical protein [Vibrio mediterranei]
MTSNDNMRIQLRHGMVAKAKCVASHNNVSPTRAVLDLIDRAYEELPDNAKRDSNTR